jgi:hypothetical protein
VAHRRLDISCIAKGPLSRPLSKGLQTSRGDKPVVFKSVKLQAIPSSLEHHFPLAQLMFHSSASLSQSTPSLMWIDDLISMASTYCQPIAYSTPHRFTIKLGFQFSEPPIPLNASRLSCAARFNLSAINLSAPLNGRGFQAAPAVGQSLLPAYIAQLSEDGETFNSENDDDDLPFVKQILASLKRAKWVVNLTSDDDDDREGDDSDFTKVSWLRTTRTARHLIRLIPPSIDRIQVADQLHSPSTALSAKVISIYCRRPHNVVYSGHTWQEEKSLGQCLWVVIIAQKSRAFRQAS